MATRRTEIEPRTFFLNEAHELVRAEKTAGGRAAKYVGIDWTAKGQKISRSLARVESKVKDYDDPTASSRYFMVATPQRRVQKASSNKKLAPDGVLEEETDFAGAHSRTFRRLGMDLLSVSAGGVATVHTTIENFRKLVTSATQLDDVGEREQAKWATIDNFALPSVADRTNVDWLDSLAEERPTVAVIELQPVLSRSEIDAVFRKIASLLAKGRSERLFSNGSDFSGRHWVKGEIRPAHIREIAERFLSVQTIHQPLLTEVAGRRNTPTSNRQTAAARATEQRVPIEQLPVVAMVDVGVPSEHPALAPYKRGQVIALDSIEPGIGDHGTFVASRIVFGDLEEREQDNQHQRGTCRFLDVSVASDANHVDDKGIVPSMQNVVATYPDVRVFNLSFGRVEPLAALDSIQRQERLSLLRDLDNFVFANDVVVVVCAGNSPAGVVPNPMYPDHLDVPEWQLGAWAMGFNTLVCGSSVDRLSAGGLVNQIGWPSPFTRIGPGIAGCPVPGFSAHGGNCTSAFGFNSGLGVYGYNREGFWEDRMGTSYASPLLAREAVFAMRELQKICGPGGRPFSVAVKAFLALTAQTPNLPPRLQDLGRRTLGRGRASSSRLAHPRSETAVLVWQGVLSSPDDMARVQIPIPQQWLQEATAPILRVVWAWDSPVNDVVENIWGCRKVSIRLRPGPDQDAIYPKRSREKTHQSYPLGDKSFDLSAEHLQKISVTPSGDIWLLELSYDDIADYYPAMEFTPNQRVAFCAELFDANEEPTSPQQAVQALPVASSMVQLTVPKTPIQTPVVIRFRR